VVCAEAESRGIVTLGHAANIEDSEVAADGFGAGVCIGEGGGLGGKGRVGNKKNCFEGVHIEWG
jgi:hypothetical protein